MASGSHNLTRNRTKLHYRRSPKDPLWYSLLKKLIVLLLVLWIVLLNVEVGQVKEINKLTEETRNVEKEIYEKNYALLAEENEKLESEVQELRNQLEYIRSSQESNNEVEPQVNSNPGYGMINVSETQVSYQGSKLESDTGFRSYLPCTAIKRSSIQGQIVGESYPDSDGIMNYYGVPCAAIGTGWGYEIGDIVRVYTDIGTFYDILVADIKDNKHTDWTNKVTALNGCVVEFIVDVNAMDSFVRRSGNIANIEKYSGYVLNIEKIGCIWNG